MIFTLLRDLRQDRVESSLPSRNTRKSRLFSFLRREIVVYNSHTKV